MAAAKKKEQLILIIIKATIGFSEKVGFSAGQRVEGLGG
jgi:hypothetical protein